MRSPQGELVSGIEWASVERFSIAPNSIGPDDIAPDGIALISPGSSISHRISTC